MDFGSFVHAKEQKRKIGYFAVKVQNKKINELLDPGSGPG